MSYWFKKFFSDPAAHGHAVLEVITVSFFLVLPFMSLYFRNYGTHAAPVEGPVLEKGQIFVLIYGLAGSVIYTAFGTTPHNWPKTILGFGALFLLMPVFLLSGFDPNFASIINDRVNTLGLYGFSAMVVLYYALLVFEALEPPDPSDVLRSDETVMAKAARELNQ